jgi:predicted carbohydrate-binding protein with CBM5 and CBM33 domain
MIQKNQNDLRNRYESRGAYPEERARLQNLLNENAYTQDGEWLQNWLNENEGRHGGRFGGRHGYGSGSRGAYAKEKGWLQDWHIHEFEGGKAFPTATVAGIPNDDNPSHIPPADGYICSGGRQGEWDLVNCTDSELQAKKGQAWPRTSVSSGQVFKIDWSYNAVHKTRGYNYWITKDGWNPNSRITVAQLESKPFFSDFNTETPYWSHPLPKKDQTSVTLPQKTGYHVMIVPWIIADTGMAFYQTFDLDFGGGGPNPQPAPVASITPATQTKPKGSGAPFDVNVQGGTAPFTYLWNLPAGLTLHHGDLYADNVMYATYDVSSTQTFGVNCRVTDASGKTSTANAALTVTAGTNPSPEEPSVKVENIAQTGDSVSFNVKVTMGR